MFSKQDLVADFKKIGLRAGDLVCVHSSYKSIGPVDGGANTVIDALIETVGPKGTLMFPAFTFYLLEQDAPVFDFEKSPSCVGFLSELFRTEYAEQRSVHVSHSYSVRGPLTKELCAHSEDITPCDAATPLGKLLAMGGKILMIGCSYNCLTAVHVIEETNHVPYVRFKAMPGATIMQNGKSRPLASKAVYPFSYEFTRLEQPLKQAGGVKEDKIGNAASLLINGTILVQTGTNLIKENPNFLAK